MTRSKNQRWPASRKRDVAGEIATGARTKVDVLAEFPDLSEEELDGWLAAYVRGKGDARQMQMGTMIAARKTVPA